MEYLEHKLAIEELQGIHVTEELIICHRLFVDDIGIFIQADEGCFRKLQEVLKTYELASGVKLNLAKLVIIPLAMTEIPLWLHAQYGSPR